MSDIIPTPAAVPAAGSRPQVQAPSSTSDNPSPQQQSPEGGEGTPPEHGERTPARGHDPAVVVSAKLARLSQGAEITVTVAGVNAEGLVRLTSALGTLVTAPDPNLNGAARLRLRILSVDTTLKALVLSIDGKTPHPPLTLELALTRITRASLPPEAIAAQDPQAAVPATARTYAPTPEAAAQLVSRPDALRPGTRVTATIIGTTATDPGPPGDTGTADRATGIELVLSLLSHRPGAGDRSPAIAGAENFAPAPTVPSELEGLKIEAVVTAEVSHRATQVAQSLAHIRGHVSDPADATKAVLLQTSIGLLRARMPASVAVGDAFTTRVIAAASAAPDRPVDAGPTMRPEDFQSLLALTQGWPALDQALNTVKRVAPGLAQTLGQTVIPGVRAPLGPALLFFLAALRLSAAKAWLGSEVADTLARAGRADLLRRLGDDMDRILHLASDAPSNQWRPLVLPFHDGRNLVPLILYVHRAHDDEAQKRDQQAEDADRKAGSLRFVLDLDLSRLGALQLDGLVANGRFDLILRSRHGLDGTLRTALAQTFHDANSGAGLDGDIVFETGAPFPVAPLRLLAPPAGAPARETHI